MLGFTTKYHISPRSGVSAATILGTSITFLSNRSFPKERSFLSFCTGCDALKMMEMMAEKLLESHRSFRCFPHTLLSREKNRIGADCLSTGFNPGKLGLALLEGRSIDSFSYLTLLQDTTWPMGGAARILAKICMSTPLCKSQH
jgi:hypothetical protein